MDSFTIVPEAQLRRVAEVSESRTFQEMERITEAKDRERLEGERRVAVAKLSEWREADAAERRGLNEDILTADETFIEARKTYRECEMHLKKLTDERQRRSMYATARENVLRGAIRKAADPKLLELERFVRRTSPRAAMPKDNMPRVPPSLTRLRSRFKSQWCEVIQL